MVEGDDGILSGVDAVIDKDRATSVLAREVKADRIVILTQVDSVYLDFGGPSKKRIERMSVQEARAYLKDGQFAPGSMGPKIEAAVDFLEWSGGGAGRGEPEVLITSPDLIDEALEGRVGTRILP